MASSKSSGDGFSESSPSEEYIPESETDGGDGVV